MSTIVANSQVTTVVTIFTVTPEHQQQLIDLLVRASQEVRKQPGFVSINIHKSIDGTHVLSYSQWESRQAFDEALQNAAVIQYVQSVLKLATFEPNFYEVAAVIGPDKAADQG